MLMRTTCFAPVSIGELVDKITILTIKTRHIQGSGLNHIHRELASLEHVYTRSGLAIEAHLVEQLQQVNQDLWEVEDALRKQEQRQDFGHEFVSLARSVYQLNDHRAAIKYQINMQHNSELVEEKSYGNA
jgi:hypothetical protein